MKSAGRLMVGVVIAGLVGVAGATTVIPIAVEELASRSSAVVEAQAVERWSQWDEQQHLIFTYTRFRVDRSLKGAALDTVVVRQMGGTAGGYTQKVSGVRHWLLGEEAVLFLRPGKSADGAMTVVGLMQGSFRIVRTESGESMVSNGVPDVLTFNRALHGSGIFTGTRMSLRELEDRVGKAAAR